MLRNRLRWQSKNKERLLDYWRSISFLQSHKDSTCLYQSGCWQHRYYITKVGHWRKDVLEGHALFCFKLFSAKDICTMNVTFFTLICIWNRARSVSFKTVGRVIDRDIIFRDRTYLVFFFLSCVVKFQAREANSCWILAIEFVCFFSFVPSFLFLFLFTFSIVSPLPLPLSIKLVKPVRRHSKC